MGNRLLGRNEKVSGREEKGSSSFGSGIEYSLAGNDVNPVCIGREAIRKGLEADY